MNLDKIDEKKEQSSSEAGSLEGAVGGSAVVKSNSEKIWKWSAIGLAVILVGVVLLDVNVSLTPRFGTGKNTKTTNVATTANTSTKTTNPNLAKLQAAVLPSAGVTLPIEWGDLGRRMVEAGVIDSDKFQTLYSRRGGLSASDKNLLIGEKNNRLSITPQNAGVVLNLLWAFGLSNRNPILEEGPMQNPQYGGAGRFASTGGWTLSQGSSMNHYGKHPFVTLTANQQQLVERVSKNIYRPCCNNATYFPDCNHGMAMLGLLQLMAANDMNEADMYKAALKVNSYWFPSTYLTLSQYFSERGVDWSEVDAKTVLGAPYSSASGYRQIRSQVAPTQTPGGSGVSCGVSSSAPTSAPAQAPSGGVGCGV